MGLRQLAWDKFTDYLIERSAENPYFNLEGYMDRSWIIDKSTILPFTARVHKIKRSDLDRHMHDHPGWNISVILRNAYKEVMPVDKVEICTTTAHPKDMEVNNLSRSLGCSENVYVKLRKPGDIIFRRATDRHKIVIVDDDQPVWTLFIMQKKATWWGYYVPGFGKVHWTAYSDFLKMWYKR